MNQCEAAASGTGSAKASNQPKRVAEEKPANACQSADYQRRTPAPTRAQEKQKKISQVELFFNCERPEYSVDAVAGLGVEIVKHQEVHHDVVNKEMRYVDADAQGRHEQEQREGNQVRRIKPANSASPEGSKLNRLGLPAARDFAHCR